MNLQALKSDLEKTIRGEVSFDQATRGIHSTDASQYQVTPTCVVWPLDKEDAIEAVKIAAKHKLAITPRGGGTSLSGQTMWSGMILDMSRHMDKVLEINKQEKWTRVQPGAIRDQINAQTGEFGLHFAPDPATGNRATVGGMIGNNSSGTHSIISGKTSDHVIEVTIALSDGTVLTLGPNGIRSSKSDDSATKIDERFKKIIDDNRDEIKQRFPKVMRRVSGYSLDAYLDDPATTPWNLATLIVGSEGTLGILLEAKINLTPLPGATALCAVHFDDLLDSLSNVPPILEHGPAAVELLDSTITFEAKKNPSVARYAGFIEGEPQAILLTEFFGDTQKQATDKAYRLAAELEQKKVGSAWPVIEDPNQQQDVWLVRKLGLGLLSNLPGTRKRQPFVEDACVPVAVLAQYIQEVQQVCANMNIPLALYGHASVGVLHVNPMLDLHQQEDVDNMKSIAEQVFELVKKYGGSWSGEHGDGIVRGAFLERFFGTKIYQAFKEVKNLFDPAGLMNPGKIIDVPPMTENLRYGKQYKPDEIKTEYNYNQQGSFALAVEKCNGVGACRKIGSGTMCPSYMATRDEEHSTRGRANALRLAMSGQLGKEALASERIHDVLDLCLSCKACKSECPNEVDMAKLKSETTQMYYDKNGTPFAATMVAQTPKMARSIAGPLAPVVNWVQRRGAFKWTMEKLAKVDRRRTLPSYARQSFTSWFFQRKQVKKSARKVVLFEDTFTNYYQPEVGKAAVNLLEGCGYEVLLAQAGCCQRTRLSKGFVRLAKRDGSVTMKKLDKYATEDLPILAIEPSCASALNDDLPDLIDDGELGQRVGNKVMLIENFLAQEIEAGRLHAKLTSPYKKILTHGHCHQKSLYGMEPLQRVLGEVEGLETKDTNAGCCGMAGAFGYEHYDISMKIAEDRMAPAIRNRGKETGVAATGFSCRHQIADTCDAQAKHWVEMIEAKPIES